MRNVHFKKLLLGGASTLIAGMIVAPALAQEAGMETVVVTGIRASLTSAQAIKQNSDQVVDSITAVDIGALPDRNIAEALQRVPGVTLVRTDTPNDLVRMGSTGQSVYVRGLAWVKSLVNGRDEFTAVAGRNLSFGDVSADLMAAVNVYKSPTASQIEGGVGGTVDLITRKPFDQDGRVIAISGDYTYGDLLDKAVPSGNALYSDRWNTKIGEIGVLASVDWQQIVNRTVGINVNQWGCWDIANALSDPDGPKGYNAKDGGYNECMALPLDPASRVIGPTGWAWRQMEFDQKRLASNLVVQWRPSDKLEFTLFAMNTYAHNQDMEHYDYSLINVTQMSAGTFDANYNWLGGPSTLTSIDTRGGSGHNRNTDISLNIKFNPTDRLEITADLQFVESSSPYRNMTFYTQGVVQPNTSIDVSGAVPVVSVDNIAENSDPANYIFPFAMDHLQYNAAHSGNFRVDAKYDFEGGGLFGLIKSVEAGFRTEQKISVERNTGWNWAFIQQTWLSEQGAKVTLDGTIHCTTAPCSWIGADGNTYTSATGGLQTALDQAELFSYQSVLGNNLPALWVPKASLARMNTIDSYGLMQAYLPGAGNLFSWYAGNQNWAQWIPYGVVHSCSGDDVTCLAAYDLTPGDQSAGNRKSRQKEETYAGYFQLNYSYDTFLGLDVPIDGNIGLRIVHTKDRISSGLLVMPTLQNGACSTSAPVNPGDPAQSSSCNDWNAAVAYLGGVANAGTTIARPSVSNNYTNYLPSFNFRARLSDEVQTRLAYYETIVRPNFGLTYNSATLSFDFFDANSANYGVFEHDPAGYGGNPYLKPMKARNYDASIEWYFAATGSLTLSLFHKDLSDYIYSSTTVWPITDPVSGQTMDFNYTTYVNGDKGKVEGFEIAYQQFYDQLPGFWAGFGIQANYTKIYNSGGHNQGTDIANPTAVASANDETLPLEGMSNDSYNVALLYAKYGIDARLAWNWRSTYLSSSSDANNKIPVWVENYGQLDGSVFYSFMEHYKIGMQVTNILGANYKTDMGYMDFHPRTNTIEQDRKVAIIFRSNW